MKFTEIISEIERFKPVAMELEQDNQTACAILDILKRHLVSKKLQDEV